MKRNNTLSGCLCALGCEVLYGMSYIFTKQATQTSSALSLLGWRFLIAFLLMNLLLVFRIVHINIRGKHIAPLLTVAMFCPVLYFLGETFGISKTTASESGVSLNMKGRTKEDQLKCAGDLYDQMVGWYDSFLQTENGRVCLAEFDRTLPGYVWMSDVKKIDFYLWSIRN